MLVASRVLGLDGETAPSERVRLGVVGLGGRGSYIATIIQQAKDCQLVAISDIFKPNVDRYMKDRSDWLKSYEDFRKMIETEKLDGVCCETCTHQRAWVAIHSMLCGANVYIEKPMALTIKEGRAM
ncbi:MAG: Gfo/Idh/MocA family oxidoreductase, partial [Thermoguttaceae bacterium]|nr:Gfo/Idh/MocA family oxidoreductase [Thermoguttaceae bacterium]